MQGLFHKGKIIFLSLFLIIGIGQQIWSQTDESNTIRGIVRTTDGSGIGGVEVSITERFRFTVTDNDGKFVINADPGDELFFSKENFHSLKKEVEFGINDLDIVLLPLEEENRIAVAYGYRFKSELTHSVSVIGSDMLERSPVPNLSNAIAGKGTGLTVIKNSGDEPGYDNSTYYVRGVGTFSDFRSPLVLVDNVERDFTQLDPMEIESFTILKDAAATVKYGLRGANGVINVRTRRGFTGRPEISFVSQAGFQTPSRLPDFLSASEYVRFYNIALENDGLPLPDGDKFNPDMYDGSHDTYRYPDVDWYGEFLKDFAPIQQHKLSMRGGTTAIRYFLFLGFTQQDGIYKYTDLNPQYSTNPRFDRYNLRSNIDVDVTESLLVSVDLATRVENRHVPNSSAGAIFSTLSQLPPNAMPVENRDGSIAGTSLYRNNPLGMISRTGYRDNYQRNLLGNVEATQKLDFILDGLALTGMVGLDGTNFYALGRSQQYAVYQEIVQNDSIDFTQYGENTDISLGIQKFDDSFSYMFTSIGGLTYFNTMGNNTLGADLKYMQSRYFPHGNNIAYSNQNIFGRATYGIDNTYFIELGLSYSGSDNFSPGNRFGFFPAISGAWILSNESFMANNNSIQFLKLRGSAGITGNSQLGTSRFPYEYRYYSGGGYIFGSGFSNTTGAYEGRIGNPNLRWEESFNSNIGVDLELATNFSASLDVFNHYRYNIITTGENIIPSVFGQQPRFENNGTVVNRGLETMLRYRNHQGNLRYQLQGNVSFATNKILNMDEVEGMPDYQYLQGNPVTSIWGLESIGLFQDQNEIDNSPQQTFDNVRPGDIRFKDQNNDGIIDLQDQIVIGNSIPTWNFGLSGSFVYSNFDLHFVLNGILGRTIILSNNSVWILQGNNKATDIAYDSWQAGVNENDAKYPRLTTMSNNNNYNHSTFWARSGDYLRLTNLEIGYSLSPSILSERGIREIRFFLNAYNLFSIDATKKYNLDPEVPNAGVTGYPVMRIFNSGLNINF